jgi:glucokinase
MVAPAVRAPLVIALDVGGTKIASGLVDRKGHVIEEREVASPDDSASESDVLDAIDAVVEVLLDDRVAAIDFGIPAHLERGSWRILWATNLPLDDVDLVTRARERFGLPVGIENDASAAALAEWKRGAGRGTSNLLMLTLGTGVGGGIVVDGRLFRGWAELGHVVVREGGEECTCGAVDTSRCWPPAVRATGRPRSSTVRAEMPASSSNVRQAETRRLGAHSPASEIAGRGPSGRS